MASVVTDWRLSRCGRAWSTGRLLRGFSSDDEVAEAMAAARSDGWQRTMIELKKLLEVKQSTLQLY